MEGTNSGPKLNPTRTAYIAVRPGEQDPIATSRGHSIGTRGPRLISGVGAVLLLTTCGKWGAYLGLANQSLYLTDVLLIAAAVNAVRWLSPPPSRAAVPAPSSRGIPGPMLLVFFGYVLLRFILSPDFSLIALRDAAPYLYAAIAILSAHSYHASSEAARMRTIRLLQFGLRIHIVWVLVALAIPTAVAELPTLDPAGHVTYLLLRQDFDGAMLGVFVGLALNRSWKGTSSRSDYLFVVIAAAEVAMMGNRSGLLALLAGIVTSVLALLAWQSTDKRSRARKLTLIAAVPIVTVFALAVLSQTPAGSKLAASLGLVLPQSDIQFTGVGTQRARSAAWPVVIDYMSNDTARALVGVGFGPNFMVDSGAIMQLVGSDTPDVRSPHNYLVGTYARLGLIGLVLFLGLTIAICRQIIRIRSTLVHDELLMFAALVCVTVLVVSMFGVVLESPFGAVPFFWSAGLLLGQPIVKRECASSVGRSRLMGVGHRPG